MAAGVSKTTVSHVINETRAVEAATRQKVLAAVDALGYRPNLLARSLTTHRTGIVGMLISDSSNYFFGELIQGAQSVLLPENCGLIVCSTNDVLEREVHYLELLLAQQVDGIIAAATTHRWLELYRADKQHTPIVFMDRCFEDMDWPFVGVDNCHGAYLGVRHLIDAGYTTIGLLAGLEWLSTMRERQAGYERALQEAGLPLCPAWVAYSHLSIEDGRRAMAQVLAAPERPRAVFINNNLLALGALLGLRDAGLRCPDDMALVSFDDHPWAAVSNPPLSVVRQPTRPLGVAAAEMLLGLIRHQPLAETRLILPCELVARESSPPICVPARPAPAASAAAIDFLPHY
jgi:LacI family transcriptional regulator